MPHQGCGICGADPPVCGRRPRRPVFAVVLAAGRGRPAHTRGAGPLAFMKRGTKLPKGAIQPRAAVLRMAAYSPPTAGRTGKLRLDFNENTVGCSPRVIAAIRERVDAGMLAIYPEYGAAKEAIARYFRVKPEQFVFTNGTDDAIQVFINTY